MSDSSSREFAQRTPSGSPQAIHARTLQANGQRIHAMTCGEGPLVLFLHGFPESWYSWRHQLPAVAAAGFQAVAIDQRGYGRSTKPQALEEYAVEHLIADAAAVVEALGHEQAVVVGHDWGAPIAWCAAWTRPEVFRAVSGLSVPFGGRGLTTLPGDPFGERLPSEVEREIAGEGRLFYQEYFCLPDHVAEREADADLRRWMTGVLFGLSGNPALPPPLDEMDLLTLPHEVIVQLLQGAVSVPEDGGMNDVLQWPDELPAWLTPEDLEHFVTEFEHTGLTGPLNYYRNIDRSWAWLGEHATGTLDVPSQFIGADRDIVTIWAQEAIARQGELRTDIRNDTIVRGSIGHWIQQEDPQATNDALLRFLKDL